MRIRRRFMIPILLMAGACASGPAVKRAEIGPKRETVFLLHGMGRSRLSMVVLARRFRRAGYRTVNIPYSQTFEPMGAVTLRLKEAIREEKAGRYHLIGHSLGNIVIRDGFREGYPPGLGRIVMLAPPNRVAKLAQGLGRTRLYRWLTGDSGRKLADPEFYKTLPVPDADFAVIAGDRGNGLLSKKPNDGVVLVETTRLEGMKDFAVVHHAHTFIMNAADTFALCRRFLETGSFSARKPT